MRCARRLRTFWTVTVIVLAAALAPAAGAAPRKIRQGTEIEDLGVPVKSSVCVRETLIEDLKTGDLHLVGDLASMPMQIFDFNLTQKTARITDPVKGAGWRAWVAYPHTNGKFYLGSDSTLIEYDPATGAVRTFVGKVPAHKRGDMSHMVETKDGTMYLGGYGQYCWSFNPKTTELKRFGPLEGNRYFYTEACDAPWFYVATAGGGDWYLVVFNMETGEFNNYFEPAKDEPKNLMRQVGVAPDGSPYCWGTFLDDKGKRVQRCYKLTDGKPVLVDKPPAGLWASHHQSSKKVWPTESSQKVLGIQLDLSEMTPTGWNDGAVTLRWRPFDAAQGAPSNVEGRKVGDKDWTTLAAKAKVVDDAMPRRLVATDDGKLLGCTEPYGIFFTFDPETKKSAYLGRPPGNVYDLIVKGDLAFMSGYSKMFAIYDRTQPWTCVPGADDSKANPRPRLGWGKRNCYMAFGADGKVYIGGRESRHATGGVVGIYDPKTGERSTMRAEFKDEQIFDLVAINDGHLIVVSWKDKFITYSVDEQKLVGTVDIPKDVILAGNIFDGGKDAIVALTWRTEEKTKDTAQRAQAKTNPPVVFKIDVLTGKVAYERAVEGQIFEGAIRELNRRIRKGPDGCGWLFRRDDKNKVWLCRVHPDDGTVENVIETGVGGHVCFMGNDLYFYNGAEASSKFTSIRRIRNILE